MAVVVLPASNPLQPGFPRSPYNPVVFNGTTYYGPAPLYYNNAQCRGAANGRAQNNISIHHKQPSQPYPKTQRAGSGPGRNASPKPRTPLRTTTNNPRKSPSFEKKPTLASYHPVNQAYSSPALVSVDIPAKPQVPVHPPRTQARSISPPHTPPVKPVAYAPAPAPKQSVQIVECRVEHGSKLASVATPATSVTPDVVQLNSSFLRDYCSRPALFNASNPQHAQWITIIAAALTQLDSPLARSIIQEQPLVILRFQQWNLVRCCSVAIEDSAKNAKERCREYLDACKDGADPAGGKKWLKSREVKRKSPSLRQAVIVNNHRKKGELLRAKMFEDALSTEEYARAILELKL